MSFPRYVGLRISTQEGAVPAVSDMDEGELAFNVADGRVYTLMGSTIIDLTDRYTRSEIDAMLGSAAAEDAEAFDAAGSAQAAQNHAVQRSNHTGTQPLSTISDAGTAAAADITDFDPAGSAAQVEHDLRETLRQRPDPLLMHFL